MLAILGTTNYVASVAISVAATLGHADLRLSQVREVRHGESNTSDSGFEYLVHFDGWSDKCARHMHLTNRTQL